MHTQPKTLSQKNVTLGHSNHNNNISHNYYPKKKKKAQISGNLTLKIRGKKETIY